MEIALRGTEVTIIGDNVIGFEQNNLVNSIVGNIDTEAGWDFTLKVFMTKTQQYNQIPMTRDGSIIYVTLTSDMMPVGGRYVGQFEMTKGSQLMQSDTFEFWVNNSVNLNAVWTPIPTTFLELAENTRIMQLHPPIPGDNGFWLIWNVEDSEYQESTQPLPAQGIPGPYYTPNVSQEGVISWTNNGDLVNPESVNIKGPQGPIGETGPQGDPGIGLPTVTEADNGKVAYVENGVWVAKLLSEIQEGV